MADMVDGLMGDGFLITNAGPESLLIDALSVVIIYKVWVDVMGYDRI